MSRDFPKINRTNIFPWATLNKVVIILPLLMLSLLTFSQTSFHTLIDSAHKIQNIDDRIKFRLTIIKKYPTHHRIAEQYEQVGYDFYLNNDTTSAQAWWLKCINLKDALDSGNFGRSGALSNLAESYFNQRNYSVAIKYFEKIDQGIFKPNWRMCRGSGSSELFDKFKRAQCYDHLNKPSKALDQLLNRWIFDSYWYENMYHDSLKYVESVNLLIQTLKSLSNPCDVKAEFVKALNSFNVEQLQSSETGSSCISTYTYFFGRKVQFEKGCHAPFHPDDIDYTKSYYQNMLTNSLPFKLIFSACSNSLAVHQKTSNLMPKPDQ